MIGEYVNTNRGRRVTISSVVPGAQYRITAWALDGGTRRSATPAVKSVTTGGTSECRPLNPSATFTSSIAISFTVHPTGSSPPRHLSVTRILEDGIELNWLPPTEPYGEVHYVIYYTPEGGREQSIDTGSNLTHYNLTGLERNRTYTNIAVQAVNSAGRSNRSAIIAQNSHEQPGECQFISL